ncbi:NAC domain-containing protein 82 [Sesamum alatum]|uniref:NAC domain-containing protein 82 n=1 Tax=Sesamum alatum TaxID=300844 RepID=A0AAE1XRI1_9LAMI|nr:NAC domain-containing protein 82 [Sesamum alatum]
MARTSLPPGFRFHPTDIELVMYYLKRKVMGKKHHFKAISEVNIYKFSPWDLPDKSCLKSKDLEWFFFCPREKKYASGVRVKRATENGYWKTTGKDRPISYNDKTVGSVKTLVFHLGHAPQGERTDWVIHEYRILDDQLAAAGVQDTYVLCKVFKKNGPGPKNGAQYGAPFNEADWTDDDADDAQNHAAQNHAAQNHAASLASDGPSLSALMLPEKQICPLGTRQFGPGSTSVLPLTEEGPSPSAGRSTGEVLEDENDDEIVRLLAPFTDEASLLFNKNGTNQDDLGGKGKDKSLPCADGYDIYNGLSDLDSWAQMNEGRLDFSGVQKDDYSMNNMTLPDNLAYIELNDLLAPLDCPSEEVVTNQSSVGEVFGSYNHENVEQFYSEGTFPGIYTCANEPNFSPEGSYLRDNCLDVLQMVNDQFYQGSNAAYDLEYTHQQPEIRVDFAEDMERGTIKKICVSRLTESIPARSPSAAKHLALSFSPCGGSSIHIKAEVTHGAGECTNEALSVMMGGSSSCWCNLPWAVSQEMWLWSWIYLLSLVDFGFDMVLVYCCSLRLCFFLVYYWSRRLCSFHGVIIIKIQDSFLNLLYHFAIWPPSSIFTDALSC